jgi:MFS family permease
MDLFARKKLRSMLRHWLLNRAFARLWCGQTISSFGSYMTSLGLPLTALFLLHATPAQIGLLTALSALPGLLVGLLIGVWVDRLPRRPVMVVADLGRVFLLGLIPLAAVLGWLNLGWCYLVALLAGLLTVCFEIASLSFLPALLQADELATGNSRLALSSSLAEIAGPPMAGLLIQLLTAPLALLLDALSFLVSACCIGWMRAPEPPRRVEAEQPQLWREMVEGLKVLWHNHLLRALAAYICTRNFFGGSFAALYLLYTFQRFGPNPLVYSLLVAIGGLGALGGSFGANFCARRFGYGQTLIGSALLSGLLAFCTPLAVGPLPVLFGLFALSQLFGDAGFAVYSINEISLRQTLVPNHLLGRVNASMYILSNSIMPFGALLAGLLGEIIGLRLTLFLGSSGLFLASCWLILSPLRSQSPILV